MKHEKKQKEIVKELAWRGYDARCLNGMIIVNLKYPNYKSFCKARQVLRTCMEHIGCTSAWEAQFIRVKSGDADAAAE